MPALQPSPPPGLFDSIAPRYDLVNLVLSGGVVLYWDYKFKRALAKSNALHGTALDLGCGTLPLRRGLARLAPKLRMLGLDLSWPMLKTGLARLPPAAQPHTLAVQGRAQALPLPDNCLDLVVSQFAWRNLNPRPQVLAEVWRVLKPGGRIFIMDCGSGQGPIWGGVYNFYLTRVLPRVGGLFSPRKGAYQYLAHSIMAFPPARDIAGEISAAGFTDVAYEPLTSGIVFLYTACKGAGKAP